MASSVAGARRRLLRHGVLLVLMGFLAGAVVPAFTTPRLGLSAHVGAIMSGLYVVVLGLAWDDLTLPPAGAAAAFWLLLVGNWGSSGALVLAAAFGTSGMTPIAGAGHAGTAWQEALVDATLMASAAAVLVGSGIAVWGLRGDRAD